MASKRSRNKIVRLIRVFRSDSCRFVSYNRLPRLNNMGSKDLTVERYDGVAEDQRILLLRGPLTMETAPKFQRAVHHENAETMILDLSDVPYIDSVGLGSLVAAYVSHQKTGRCLVLTGLKPRVLKVMEITKVDDFFLTFGTTWEAVEALANTGTA
jgi:anti-sigma B factor antagonist